MIRRPFLTALLFAFGTVDCSSPTDHPGDGGSSSADVLAQDTSDDAARSQDVATDVDNSDSDADTGKADVLAADTSDASSQDAAPDVDDSDSDAGTGDAILDADVDHDGAYTDASDGDSADSPGGPVDGAAPTCQQFSYENLTFEVRLPNGSYGNCTTAKTDAGPTLHGLISGIVLYASAVPDPVGSTVSITIDTCGGDACTAQSVTFVVWTPTPFSVPVGAFVEAEYWVGQAFLSCSYFVRISNLPEWKGQTNPVSDTRKLYAIASDGWRNPNPMLAGTGITTQLKPIGCNADASVGCGAAVPVDHYYWLFSESGGSQVVVPMGQSLPFAVAGQPLVVRNHRSFQSDGCDAAWDWAFTIVGQ